MKISDKYDEKKLMKKKCSATIRGMIKYVPSSYDVYRLRINHIYLNI